MTNPLTDNRHHEQRRYVDSIVMKNSFKIKIPCSTSNLGPGFDTLGLALQLFLEIEVSTATEKTEFVLSGEGKDALPLDESNYIYKIYCQGCEIIGATPRSLHIKVRSDIPLSRGLGSSGSAVVAALVMANELNGGSLTRDQIAEIATRIEGHPENVSASCYGGLTVGCLANEKLFSCQILPQESLKAVTVIPEIEILTREARTLLPEHVPFAVAVNNVQRATLFAAAMATGQFDVLREASKDKLHQPFRKKLIPGFDALLESAYEAGALAAFLSGSGSTIVALVQENASRVEDAMLSSVASFNYSASARTLDIAREGYRVD
ncbi:MAG: homoserine kinase [Calditrichaeota bacterium]|nr:MAG: homoserine kinase [Calditrichota bacterium]